MSIRPAPLEALAKRARGGESVARNLLWEEMQAAIKHAVSRQRNLPRLWDREDLEHEAFLVFVGVCSNWSGSDFEEYFEQSFAAELARHVRRAWRRGAREVTLPLPVDPGHDPAAAGGYDMTEMFEGLSRLPARIALALRLHLIWGLPLAQVGERLGLGRREVEALLPTARRIVQGSAGPEEERIERMVRLLYSFADEHGRIRASARQVRAYLGLSSREHAELIAGLEERGVLTGRGAGHAGSLLPGGSDAALRLLQGRDRQPA